MDAHGADVAHLAQPHVHPGLPGVDGLPHALADGDVGAVAVGARAHVDGVGVRVRDVDVAHGPHGDLAVAEVRPVRARVGGLPDAAARGAEVERVRLLDHAGHGGDAAAAGGTDHAPAELVIGAFAHRGGGDEPLASGRDRREEREEREDGEGRAGGRAHHLDGRDVGEAGGVPAIDTPATPAATAAFGQPGGTACRSTATKWQALPARTQRCQAACP
jgi:hypothetical protein